MNPGVLLAMDVGNTNLVVGIYDGSRLAHSFRLRTDKEQTVDEYGILIKALLAEEGYRPEHIRGICVSSVVPILTDRIEELCRRLLKRPFLFVSPELELGVGLTVENSREVGADLLAAAVAVLEIHGAPAVVVDFGTATTMSVLSREGVFLGAVIAPGLSVSLDAILQRAPHLPPVRLEPPPRAYGTNTVEALQAGLLLGHASLIEGLVGRIEKEVGPCRVIATGGLAAQVASVCSRIDRVEPDLVLEGIRRIWEKNRPTTPEDAESSRLRQGRKP
ncbi:MAG: type III pantothenate kinase [Armatimonadetes bacterium]|nr:type III pantothenate kinase [Armatimonadota bacterium]